MAILQLHLSMVGSWLFRGRLWACLFAQKVGMESPYGKHHITFPLTTFSNPNNLQSFFPPINNHINTFPPNFISTISNQQSHQYSLSQFLILLSFLQKVDVTFTKCDIYQGKSHFRSKQTGPNY